jgi:membrane peptidoglycan carboxypeptidase
VQAVAPQVAAEAVNILTHDTRGDGTTANVFSSFDFTGRGRIAGKTGTNQAYPQTSKNSAVWFVGMTPNLVAATGVINFDNPSAPSTGLRTENRGEAYGDFAARVWWDALQPTVANQSWSWQNPNDVSGTEVPDVTGMSYSDARDQLASSGFKIHNLDAADNLNCAANAPFETVGYYGPHVAKPGSTITVCISSGVPGYVPPPPPPPPVITHPTNTGNGNHRSSTPTQPKPKPKPTKRPGH